MNLKLRENISHGTKEYPYSQHRIHGVPYGFHFPVHWHEEMEWIYVRKGHLLVNAGGTDYDLTDGQVLIVNPRQLHRMQSDDTAVNYYTILFSMELISFQSSDLLEQTVFQPLRTGQKSLPNLVPAMDMSLSKLRETVKDKEAWHAAVHGVARSWPQLNSNKNPLCAHARSCPALCHPVDCHPPDCSVHGVSQARTLECADLSYSRRSS